MSSLSTNVRLPILPLLFTSPTNHLLVLSTPSSPDNDEVLNDNSSDSGSDLDFIDDLVAELTLEEFNDAVSRNGHLDELRARHHTTLPFGAVTIESYTVNGLRLSAGTTVELVAYEGETYGDFLRIETILQDLASDNIVLRGLRFRRTHRAKGMLEKKANEVYIVQHLNEERGEDIRVQSLEDIPVSMVICERMLVVTNSPFPRHSWRDWDLFEPANINQVRESAQLVCRWSWTFVYGTLAEEQCGRISEQRLERLSASQANKDYSIPDEWLRNSTINLAQNASVSSYRNAMKRHAARHTPDSNRAVVIDLDAEEEEEEEDDKTLRRTSVIFSKKQGKRPVGHGRTIRNHDQEAPHITDKYVFGDAFCGAGGVSSGARSAGLRVKWAFDYWLEACRTYSHNFHGTRIFRKDAHSFITRWSDNRMVDILHLSPPCQKFSPAHTVNGKDDDANEAALFAVGTLIQQAKPRIVTIEETSGIVTHHPIFLHALISQLTRQGYSLRWKLMNFADYGVAQPRKRLVMIGSCPGEPLPPFPKPTHGTCPCPGLKPYETIRSVTAAIRPGMPNHNPARCIERDAAPYDPNTQLRSCITTSGGQGNTHWSGRRSFTERELACLQGFPLSHVFLGGRTAVKKQIGNAVPPVVAELMYRTIIETLRATDAADAAKGPSSRQSVPGESVHDAILLD